MPDLIANIIQILSVTYLVVAIILAIYALHALAILIVLKIYAKRSITQPTRSATPLESCPDVVTQIPLYNEANVAERVIRAAAAMDYPGHHVVQVLDDSSDETCDLVDAVAADLRRQGHSIEVVRRGNRTGYKAGALKFGLDQSSAPLIAVFDADFIPPKDFLIRTVPQFSENPKSGFVQGRWTFLNETDSFLTRAQGVGLDSHFGIEQDARSSHPAMFMNFNGTAGIWRREAIDAAGGWSADTLTEDLDLSYRVQLAGWSGQFLPDLGVAGELPPTFSGYKSQQFRWAKGSIQTALKLLPAIITSKMRWIGKVEAIFHLTHYAVHPLILVLVFLAPIIAAGGGGIAFSGLLGLVLIVAAFSPTSFYAAGQMRLHGDWLSRLRWLPAVTLTGMGVAASNTRAIIEAITGHHTAFIRTPKRGDQETHRYRVKFPVSPEVEFFIGLYALAGAFIAIHYSQPGITTFSLLASASFLTIGSCSLMERWRSESWKTRASPAAPKNLVPTQTKIPAVTQPPAFD